ncbi:unnamed protein product [Lepidochelys kempii]
MSGKFQEASDQARLLLCRDLQGAVVVPRHKYCHESWSSAVFSCVILIWSRAKERDTTLTS